MGSKKKSNTNQRKTGKGGQQSLKGKNSSRSQHVNVDISSHSTRNGGNTKEPTPEERLELLEREIKELKDASLRGKKNPLSENEEEKLAEDENVHNVPTRSQDYDRMLVKDLREKLRERNLSEKGRKDDLVQRLQDSDLERSKEPRCQQ